MKAKCRVVPLFNYVTHKLIQHVLKHKQNPQQLKKNLNKWTSAYRWHPSYDLGYTLFTYTNMKLQYNIAKASKMQTIYQT